MVTIWEIAAHSVYHMFSLYFGIVISVISHFIFWGGALVLIASVPGHCLSFFIKGECNENVNIYDYLPLSELNCVLNVRGPFGKYVAWSFFLSNRLTNPFIFGIILNSYLSSMSGHKYHDNIIMQTRNILPRIHVLFVYWKTQNDNEIHIF